ncbi:hypothetical protein DSUL_60054 [Desulfovibrionales bacterium]
MVAILDLSLFERLFDDIQLSASSVLTFTDHDRHSLQFNLVLLSLTTTLSHITPCPSDWTQRY